MSFCVCTFNYFDSILCNIFVELEHCILFNNFDKYHNFIYHRINMKLMAHRQFMSCCKYSILSLSAMEREKTSLFKDFFLQQCLKNTLLLLVFYFGHGCVASHIWVTSPPPPPHSLSLDVSFSYWYDYLLLIFYLLHSMSSSGSFSFHSSFYSTGQKKRFGYLVGNLVATNWPIEKALHAIGCN